MVGFTSASGQAQQVLWDNGKRNFLYILNSDGGRTTKLAVRFAWLKTDAVNVNDAATGLKVQRDDITIGLKRGRYERIRWRKKGGRRRIRTG